MFNWRYLRLQKHLEIGRDQARTLYEYAKLVQGMPGAVAQIGDCSDALLQLLALGAGEQREIVAYGSHHEAAPPARRRISNLPGLSNLDEPVYGIRQLNRHQDALLRADLRHCLIHILEQDPEALHCALQIADRRLHPQGLLLVDLPTDVSGLAMRTVLDDWLQQRSAHLQVLPSGYALVIPLVPRRVDEQPAIPAVRYRYAQGLAQVS